MKFSIKNPTVATDANKCLLVGDYTLGPASSNLPVQSYTSLKVVSIDDSLLVQTAYQYFDGAYAGRSFFRVGSSTRNMNGTSTGNFQSWIEIHGVGKPYSKDLIFASAAKFNIASVQAPGKDLYMQNAVTVVSDERHKNNISELTQQELECAIACGKLYKRYKLNEATDEKGDDARFHLGVISQEIVQCFNDHGLDWKKYGIVTYEKWDAIQATENKAATYDEQGNQITPEIPAVEGRESGEIYMIRYEELNGFINAGLEFRLTALEAKFK